MPTKQLYEVVDASIEFPDVSGTYPVQYGSCRIPNDSCYFNKADNSWNFTFGQKVKFWLRPFDLSAHDREVEGKTAKNDTAIFSTKKYVLYEDALKLLQSYATSNQQGGVRWVKALEPPKDNEVYYIRDTVLKIKGTALFKNGSWYDLDGEVLSNTLIEWLDESPSINKDAVEGDWVRVEDGLPEVGKDVLVSLENGWTILMGNLFNDGWMCYYRDKFSTNNNDLNKVTHWQPLPAPPVNPIK